MKHAGYSCLARALHPRTHVSRVFPWKGVLRWLVICQKTGENFSLLAYLLTSFSHSSKLVMCESSSPISPSLWIGPTWAPPLRKFWYADLSAETCSVWTSTVTVARAVTRVTVELDESESTGGVLLRFERLLLLRGAFLWRVRLPPEPDDFSSCLAIVSRIQSSESVGGVLCLHLELGRNSLLDAVDEAVPGGRTSSICEIKSKEMKVNNDLTTV